MVLYPYTTIAKTSTQSTVEHRSALLHKKGKFGKEASGGEVLWKLVLQKLSGSEN